MRREHGFGYRRDVQGLRAVAVILVVIYHVGADWLPGGFVGVDVFFVVSGFVICSSLLREQASGGDVSLGGFYSRRVRRLLPAFAAMTVTTVLLSIAFLELGSAQVRAARTALAATLSASNLYLGSVNDNYFGVAEDSNPFLHTWSLGVEEQFYLVMPLLLIGLVRLSRATRWSPRSVIAGGFAALAALSFGWSVSETLVGRAAAAFYSPLTRFWEMAAGVVLACLVRSVWHAGRLAGVIAGASAAMVAAAAALYDGSTTFPGVAALLPVAGTVGLIVAVPASAGWRQLLEHPAMVWIGDRSYGWYLWHWPLIVLAGHTFGRSVAVGTTASTVALMAAAVSYRLLERPITHGPWRPRLAGARLVGGAVATVSVVAAVTVVFGVGARTAWGVELAETGRMDGVVFVERRCHGTPDAAAERCTFRPAAESGGVVLLLGDSHAGAAADGVIAAGLALGRTVVVLSTDSCPVIDVDLAEVKPRCERTRVRARELLDELAPDIVVVAHRSWSYLEVLRRPDGEPYEDLRAAAAAWRDALVDFDAELAAGGSSLIALSSVPELPPDRHNTMLSREAEYSDLDGWQRERALALEAERGVLGDRLVDPIDTLCDGGRCKRVAADGAPLYFDRHHLTRSGSLLLAPQIERALVSQLCHNLALDGRDSAISVRPYSCR